MSWTKVEIFTATPERPNHTFEIPSQFTEVSCGTGFSVMGITRVETELRSSTSALIMSLYIGDLFVAKNFDFDFPKGTHNVIFSRRYINGSPTNYYTFEIVEIDEAPKTPIK